MRIGGVTCTCILYVVCIMQSCCSCCLLGIDASSAGVSCDLFSYRFPSTCADTFKTCCHESNAEKTTSPIIVTEPPPRKHSSDVT